MSTESGSILDWSQLMTDLEQLWHRPPAAFLGDLLSYIRHDLIALIEPVALGTKLLLEYFELSPELLAWLQQSQAASKQWLLNCRQASADCVALTPDPAEQCRCFLAQIRPAFNACSLLLTTMPEAGHLVDAEASEMLAAIQRGLGRLANISSSLERGDLTWLKELLSVHDEQGRRPAP